jgi:hypothetical protein
MVESLKLKHVLIGVAILLLGWYIISPQTFPIKFSAEVPVYQTGSQGSQVSQGEATVTTQPSQVQGVPVYQIGTVKVKYQDYFSGAPVSNLEVEALQVPSSYTYADLVRIAQDPNRIPLASVTTDSQGYATFTSIISGNVPTLYAARGEPTYYDSLDVLTVPIPTGQFAISSYTFPGAIKLYKIGSFVSPGTDVTGATTDSLNVTKTTSGIQFLEITFTIGEATAGAALKNPVLVIRTPDSAPPLANGMIQSLYIVRDTGADLGIPVVDLKGYINGVAIPLRGSLRDSLGNTFLTVADKGVYKIKLTWDASKAVANNEIDFVLDDLGAYRGTDVATVQPGANPAVLRIVWTS